MELAKEVKVDTRRIMVSTINAMGLSDIEQTLAEEGRWDALRGQIIQSVTTKHPEVNTTKLRHMVDSAAGNMVKCAQDLGQDMPEGVDMAKLEMWRLRWRAEREKSKRANWIDSQYTFSKKMRFEQSKEVKTLDPAQPESTYLSTTKYNSQCSYTLGIPVEAITFLEELGSGSYGTVNIVRIEGISFLPSHVSYVGKRFKGQGQSQLKNFGLESSVDLLHPGIVRPLAHTRCVPWILIFPHFKGGNLGDLLEMVPLPQGSFSKLMAKRDRHGKIVFPAKIKQYTPQDIERAKHFVEHAPSVIHALVQALAFAHKQGVLHNDMHPWNVMLDYTLDGIARVGIIDWGLALCVGFEFRPTNITTAAEHNARPWRAPELLDKESPCPWYPLPRASDECRWGISQVDHKLSLISQHSPSSSTPSPVLQASLEIAAASLLQKPS